MLSGKDDEVALMILACHGRATIDLASLRSYSTKPGQESQIKGVLRGAMNMKQLVGPSSPF